MRSGVFLLILGLLVSGCVTTGSNVPPWVLESTAIPSELSNTARAEACNASAHEVFLTNFALKRSQGPVWRKTSNQEYQTLNTRFVEDCGFYVQACQSWAENLAEHYKNYITLRYLPDRSLRHIEFGCGIMRRWGFYRAYAGKDQQDTRSAAQNAAEFVAVVARLSKRNRDGAPGRPDRVVADLAVLRGAGYRPARYLWATIMLNGVDGIPKDPAQAYEELAAIDEDMAAVKRAVMVADGLGVPQDTDRAKAELERVLDNQEKIRWRRRPPERNQLTHESVAALTAIRAIDPDYHAPWVLTEEQKRRIWWRKTNFALAVGYLMFGIFTPAPP